MKVIIRVSGGLANRMFQYALYKNLEAKAFDVYMHDNYKAKKWKFEDVSLKKIFPKISYKLANNFQVFCLGGGYDIISKTFRHLKIFNSYFFCGAKYGFNEEIFNFQKSKYLVGAFQSEKYFYEVRDIVRKEFVFNEFKQGNNLKIAEEMSNCNSVAIHVRKGLDYFNNKIFHNTCSSDYYNSAIKHINECIENPQFYIFSDNVQWVKQNIVGLNYTLVDWNPVAGPENYLDMQLMSCAKHNIIANSTYSWWAAWLNNDPNKIVIGPKKWYNPECLEYDKNGGLNILPDKWVAI